MGLWREDEAGSLTGSSLLIKTLAIIQSPESLPALQQRLLHVGRPVSGRHLQGVLAHAGQELQDQLGAFCFSSAALSTEGRKHTSG